jgi:hypothetical protein
MSIPMNYVPKEYPKWKYHASCPARIVHDPGEEASLGAGWCDSPAAIGAEKVEPEPEVTPPVITFQWLPDGTPESPIVFAEEPSAPESVEEEAVSDEPELDPVAQAEELHQTVARDVLVAVMRVNDVSTLKRVRDMEVQNPKYPGGRKAVLAAIDQKLAEQGSTEP